MMQKYLNVEFTEADKVLEEELSNTVIEQSILNLHSREL